MVGEIRRYSSREERLDKAFLSVRLSEASSYLRIAGYFRSSIFELVGEEIGKIDDVRIVCNSELDASDISISKAVRDAAIMGVFNSVAPEIEALMRRESYRRLYNLLIRRKANGDPCVQIRVVPKDVVFLHGKAGVITG